jgi:hypothetical protein
MVSVLIRVVMRPYPGPLVVYSAITSLNTTMRMGWFTAGLPDAYADV